MADNLNLNNVLRSVGINVPNSVFENSDKYTKAEQEYNNILSKAQADARAVSSKEAERLRELEKIMESTKVANEIIKMLPPNIQQVADAAKIVAGTLLTLNKIGQNSINTFKQVNDSLSVTGESNSLINYVTQMQYKTDKNWEEVKRNVESIFSPVTAYLSEISYTLSSWYSMVSDFSTYSSDDIHSNYYGWYTKEMESDGLSVTDMNTDISKMAAAFMNQGASMNTASNMAIALHNGIVTSDEYNGLSEEQKINMMNSALSAAISGGAYSQFGFNTSDNVLTGYLASEKDIDNVNVKLTESMETYYRIMLINQQLGADSKDVMQKQTQDWQTLGAEIENTKGKLLSFDKEIVLSGFDSTMPEMGLPSVERLDGTVFGGDGELLNNLYLTESEMTELRDRLTEVIENMDLIPEEKEMKLKLIDDELELTLAKIWELAGYTDEEILILLETLDKNPNAVIDKMKELDALAGKERATQEVVKDTQNIMLESGKITDNAYSEMAQAASDYADETENVFLRILRAISDFLNNDKIQTLFRLFGGNAYELGNKLGEWLGDKLDLTENIGSLPAVKSIIGNTDTGSIVRSSDRVSTYNYNIDISGDYVVENEESLNKMGSYFRNLFAREDAKDGGLG